MLAQSEEFSEEEEQYTKHIEAKNRITAVKKYTKLCPQCSSQCAMALILPHPPMPRAHATRHTPRLETLEPRTVMSAETLVPAAMQEIDQNIHDLLRYDIPEILSTALPEAHDAWDASYESLDRVSDERDALHVHTTELAEEVRRNSIIRDDALQARTRDAETEASILVSIDQTTESITKLNAVRSSLITVRDETLARIATLDKTLETTHTSLDEEHDRVSTLRSLITMLTANIEILDARIDDLDALWRSSSLRKSRYKETGEAWVLDRKEVKRRLDAATTERTEAIAQRTDAETALKASLECIERLETLLAETQQHRTEDTALLTKVRAQIDDADTAIRTFRTTLTELDDALECIRAQLRSDEESIDAALAALDATQQALTASTALLETAIAETADELEHVLSLAPPLHEAYDEALAIAAPALPRTTPLPADAVWPLANAPAGSIGMIPHPGLGNDYGIDISPDGTELLTGSQSAPYPVLVLDAETGAVLRQLPGQGQVSVQPRFSPDGRLIITSSYDGAVRIYDRKSATLLRAIQLDGLATSLDVSPENTIAVEVAEKGMRLIDATTGTLLERVAGQITKPSFSPSGLHLVYADGASAHIVFRPTGAHIVVPMGQQVIETDVTRDHRFAVIAGVSGDLWTLDLRTGAIVDRLPSNGNQAISLATAPGRIVVGEKGSVTEIALDAEGHMERITSHSVPGTALSLDISPSSQSYIVNGAIDHPGTSKLVKFPLLEPMPYFVSPGLHTKDGAKLLAAAKDLTPLLRTPLPALAPPDAPITERMNALNKQGAWIQARLQGLQTIEALAATTLLTSNEEEPIPIAQELLVGFQEEQRAMEPILTMWQETSARMLMEEDRLLARGNADIEPIVLRTDALRVPPLSLTASDKRVAQYAIDLPALGGTAMLQILSGKSQSLGTLNASAEDPGHIESTGAALVIDLALADSLPTAVSLTVAAEAETITLLGIGLDGATVSTIDAAPGESVTVQHDDGLMGVIVVAPIVPLSAEAQALKEYQKNGGSIDGFFQQYPSLVPQRTQIVTELQAGTRYRALTADNIQITGTIARAQGGAHEAMHPFSSAAYSALSAPSIKGIFLPEYYSPGLSIAYGTSPTKYTGFQPYVYGSQPQIHGFMYASEMDAYGRLTLTSIPQEYYRMVGDTMVLAPLGQELRMGIMTSGGQIGRPDLRVGTTYDFDLHVTNGERVQDVLPSAPYQLNARIERIVSVNEGLEPGTWVSGKSLSYSGSTPVAIGSVRAFTSYLNEGSETLDAVISVYSGHAGTPGWDQEQARYTTSIGPGQSKQLWVQAWMNANAEGSSTVHIIVRNRAGLVLADYSRTVGAPGRGADSIEQQTKRVQFLNAWNTAMVQAAADTKTYLQSIGVTDVPESAFDLPPPEVTLTPSTVPTDDAEHLVRAAFRAHNAALLQGDPERIASTETMIGNALTQYGTSIALERSIDDAAHAITSLATTTRAAIDADAVLATVRMNVHAFLPQQQERTRSIETASILDATTGALFAELGGASIQELQSNRAKLPAQEYWSLEMLAKHNAWITAVNWLKDHEESRVLDRSTIAGRVALGLAYRATAKTAEEMSRTASSVLGINSLKILSALHGVYPSLICAETLPSMDVRIEGLQRLLAEEQYAAATRQETIGTSRLSTPQTDKPEYTPDDQEIVLRFDTDLPGFHHASAYLVDTGQQQLIVGPETKLGEVRSGLELRIPMSRMAKIMGSTTWSHARIRLQVLGLDGETVFATTTEGFALEGTPLKDLSTLPRTVENAAEIRYQDTILTLLSTRFPIPGSLNQWRWDLGSRFHHDATENMEYHAMDLNLKTGGNKDYNEKLLLPADGEIVFIHQKIGIIRIRHDSGLTDAHGNPRVWYTQYDHLPLVQHDDGSIWIQATRDINNATLLVDDPRMITIGEKVFVKDYDDEHPFAVIGKNAVEYAHLHVSFFDDKMQSIDPRLLMNDLAPTLQITAIDGGENGIADDGPGDQERNVVWNEGLDAWVTSDFQSHGIGNEYLVYDRSEQKVGREEVYWMAWENGKITKEMERVVWITVKNVKKPDGSIGDVELIVKRSEMSAPKKYWNAQQREFLNIPQ